MRLSWRKKDKSESNSGAFGFKRDDPLVDSFRKAVFGDFCRTRSYKVDPGQTKTWLEAFCIPEQGWTVVKKECFPQNHAETVDGSRKLAVAQTPVKSCQGLAFFEVVQKLAEYEAGQQKRGHVPADPDEINMLGKEHFIAFAEREGIAFDINGMPYPSINGHIPGEGVFPAGTSKKAKKAYEERKLDFQTALPESVLPRISGTNKTGLLNTSIDLLEITRIFANVRQYISEAENKGWGSDVGSYSSSMISFGDYFSGKLKKEKKQLREILNETKAFAGLNDRTAFVAEITRAFDLVAFYYFLSYASGIYRGIEEVRDSDFYNKKRFDTIVEEAASRLQDLGYKDGAQEFVTERVCTDRALHSNSPKEIDTIIKWLEDMQKQCIAAENGQLENTVLPESVPTLDPD